MYLKKTNTRSTRSITRSRAHRAGFTIRRITNRNPRCLCVSSPAVRKLKKITAGLFLLFLLFGVTLLGTTPVAEQLRGKISFDNETSAAQDLAKEIASFDRAYIRATDDLRRCSIRDDCAAEIKIQTIERQLQSLKQQLADSHAPRPDEQDDLIKLEEAVLLCPDATSCAASEAALQTAREQAKDTFHSEILWRERESVFQNYRLSETESLPQLDQSGVETLLTFLFRQREHSDTYQNLYAECLAVDGVKDSCQQFADKLSESKIQEEMMVIQLQEIATGLSSVVAKLDADIAVSTLARDNVDNTNRDEGLGWCQLSVAEKQSTLNQKVRLATEVKLSYNVAVAALQKKKNELADEVLQKEAVHAAAAALVAPISQAFSFWQIMRIIF